MSEFEKENAKYSNDLDWTAFCYVANELTGEELAEFETRLEHDQEAREAVVRAVNLVQDVYLTDVDREIRVLPTTVASEAANSMGWIWKVAALLLLGVSIGTWWWNQESDTNPTVAEVPSEELAIAWVDSLEEASWDETEFDPGEELGFEDESVNDWMVSALSELEDSDLELTN